MSTVTDSHSKPAAIPGPRAHGVPDLACWIRAHYEMHHSGFISERESAPHGVLVASDLVSSPMWNHFAWFASPNGDAATAIDQARSALESRRRQPVIYVPIEAAPLNEIDPILSARGFERFDEEAWMTFDLRSAPPAAPDEASIQIVQANSETEMAAFVEVFQAAYHITDATYARALRRHAARARPNCRVRHFVLYAEQRPASVATLITLDGYAGVYNVGTSPHARGRGFAAQLMIHLMREAAGPNACRELFLQTTAGSSAQRLYQHLGFQTKFSRVGYKLKQWASTSPKTTSPRQLLQSIRRDDRIESNDSSSPATANDGVRTVHIKAPPEFPQQVERVAARCSVQPDTILTAAWAILLHRYSQEETVSFGLRRQLANRHGLCLRRSCSITVPVQGRFAEWIASLEQTFAQFAEGNGFESLGRSGDTENKPEIPENETLLALGNGHAAKPEREAIRADLEFRIPSDRGRITICYAASSFSEQTVQRLAAHFFCLVENLAADPQKEISFIEMLTPKERNQLLMEWSSSGALEPGAANGVEGNELSPQRRRRATTFAETVPALFERQVEQTPEAIALIGPGGHSSAAPLEELSYWQLNRRANQLAHHLRSLGVGPDSFVGICLDRSTEMIVALLAVLKAGGAAVPLDAAAPAERIAYMIHDTRMPVLVTSQALLPRLPDTKATLLCTDTAWETITCQEAVNLSPSHSGENIAYVIYTSGSTGNPKGVLISHRAIAAHCVDMRAFYGLGPGDRVLQFASFSFDAAFEQILCPLIAGAAVVMRGSDVWTPRELAQRLFDFELTVVDLPTAYWEQVASEWSRAPESIQPHRLRLVIVGGEAMPAHALQLWRQTPLKNVRVVNAYGPTEATIPATAHEISDADAAAGSRVPIGRPRAGRTVYVLDKWKRLVPAGVPGELHIGGPLLARGYLNRPELTKERFVRDPFGGDPKGRLYSTGDIVRFRADGALEFLGRVDDQVKLRGFRIELGEIEALLTQHAEVEQAVVLLREDSAQDKRLVAYVVPKAFHSSAAKDLRCFLQQKLPEYMILSDFVLLERLPLTVNGKVDRRALPASAAKTSVATEMPVKGPSRPLELRLQLLFEKVLHRRPIGVNVSFFELGGNSLQALEALVGIEKITGKPLPLEVLYQTSTIEGLASRLEEANAGSERSCLVPLQASGSRPPLFLIHTTPGDVLGYGNLIYHLSPDQPCYGFQSLGLCDPDLCHWSIYDMAAHYTEWLRSVQPSGPYYLAGWCYGGIVAVEMARSLLDSGEQVALLALLETIAPAPGWRMPQYYLRRVGQLLRMTPAQWQGYFPAKFKYHAREKKGSPLSPLAPAEGPVSEERSRIVAQLERVYDTNMKALRQYRSRFYPGRVTLFNASEADPALIPDPHYGWSGLAAEIEIHVVPGNHDTMLAEPHAAALADELERCLRRAQNRSKAARAPQPAAPTAA